MLPTDPVTRLAGNGYAYSFKNNDNGTIGVNYYKDGQAINNSQWGGDVSANDLERAASMNYRSYDDYLFDNGGTTSDDRQDPQIGTSIINKGQNEDTPPAPTNTTPGFNLEDERAYYGDKISTIDRLLGRVGTTQEAGIRNLNDSYNYQKGLTTKRYTDQSNENSSDKERGINQTDNFVNTSYNSLMRLLGGAGAGNSSVARTVVPTLVSKAGSARRTSVFDIFGKNQRDLDTANEENIQSLDNWKGEQEQKFNTDAENERLRLLEEKQGYEMNRNRLTNPEFQKSLVDSGQVNTGYAAAKAAGTATQNDIDTRLSNIDKLLGSYSPKYTAGLKTPELSKYTMGSAPIVQGSNQPMETGYYLPQLRKRQELNQ